MKLNFAKNTIDKCFAKFHIKRGVLAVEIKSHIGIGAKLVWLLEILAFCEENNLSPQFKFTYPGVNNQEDYFDKFFEIKTPFYQVDSVKFIKINSMEELGLDKNYNDILNIKSASYLINKYLIIKEDVLNEVDEFCDKNFSNKRVLGVHYRGTDKLAEAPPVLYDRVERNINYYLDKFPKIDVVFISSDDNNFITYAENCSVERPIIYRNDTFRSIDNASIHHSDQDKYDINRDAIMNCLILSRCDALIKTASFLSAWSKLFNPELPLIMLNKPFDKCRWFPERDLVDNVLYDSIP